jgi:DNA-binding CsgD family transcriptional regulator
MQGEKNGSPAPIEPTAEELAIVQLLAEGYKDDVVATRLGLAKRTYRRRLDSVVMKLGARSRFQAGALAFERGWLGARPDNTGSDLFSPRAEEGTSSGNEEPHASSDMKTRGEPK